MFDNSEAKRAEVKRFAEALLTDDEHKLELCVDEWHAIDEFHDIHISDSDEPEKLGLFEVWVYPIVIEEGVTKTDCCDETVYYQVPIDLPRREGCASCEWTVRDQDSQFCFNCRVSEEGDD
jgi:hypothetical protein